MSVDAFLGPQYDYVGNIPDPINDLKVGGTGSMQQLAINTGALIQYMDVLSSGCNASARKKGLCENFQNREGFDIHPLGNSFFLKTLGKCNTKNVAEEEDNSRYIYVNNRPTGQIAGTKGLIPGIIENTFDLSPIDLFMAMGMPAKPQCVNVTGKVIGSNNPKGTYENHFVTCNDWKKHGNRLRCVGNDCESQCDGFSNFNRREAYPNSYDQFLKMNKLFQNTEMAKDKY